MGIFKDKDTTMNHRRLAFLTLSGLATLSGRQNLTAGLSNFRTLSKIVSFKNVHLWTEYL